VRPVSARTLDEKKQSNLVAADQCKARGCRTIVEGEFPYCVIRKFTWTRFRRARGNDNHRIWQTSSAKRMAVGRQDTFLPKRTTILHIALTVSRYIPITSSPTRSGV
jgi:hypothetical protein